MELSLPWEAQAGARVPALVRRPRDHLNVAQAGAMRGVEFALERGTLVALREEKVAVQAGEIAVERFPAHDLVDALDRRGMAVGRDAHRLGAVQLLQLEVAVVEHVGQVAGGHARHARDERPVVEHGDRFAGLDQVVSGAQAGDTGADDADVDVNVLGQWRALRQRCRGGPDRLAAGHWRGLDIQRPCAINAPTERLTLPAKAGTPSTSLGAPATSGRAAPRSPACCASVAASAPPSAGPSSPIPPPARRPW